MVTEVNSKPPVIVIRTAPPPAWPSWTCDAACSWAAMSCSLIAWACCSREFMSKG
jgi:hypothetical protein